MFIFFTHNIIPVYYNFNSFDYFHGIWPFTDFGTAQSYCQVLQNFILFQKPKKSGISGVFQFQAVDVENLKPESNKAVISRNYNSTCEQQV